MAKKTKYDRTVEDLGNIVFLEHLNVKAPDQRLSTIFLRDGPWINAGSLSCNRH